MENEEKIMTLLQQVVDTLSVVNNRVTAIDARLSTIETMNSQVLADIAKLLSGHDERISILEMRGFYTQ